MKTISVSIDEKDLEALEVTSESLSYRELKEKIMAEQARKSFNKVHRLAAEYKLDEMTEEQVFDEVSAIKKAIRLEKQKAK